jgi:hypothetical protein
MNLRDISHTNHSNCNTLQNTLQHSNDCIVAFHDFYQLITGIVTLGLFAITVIIFIITGFTNVLMLIFYVIHGDIFMIISLTFGAIRVIIIQTVITIIDNYEKN